MQYVNDVDVSHEHGLVYRYLLDSVNWGQPVTVRVNRGLPHPFSSHPRLDLFVGSLSPHKMMDVGCTICHEGQGSATSFQWASHTPNDPHQMKEWKDEHGWFSNHHWIFPMRPERFLESSCLKCHFAVTELEPSERFPIRRHRNWSKAITSSASLAASAVTRSTASTDRIVAAGRTSASSRTTAPSRPACSLTKP